MQRRIVLLVLAMIAIVVCFGAVAAPAFAKTNVIEQGKLVTKNGHTLMQYDVGLPRGFQAAQFTPQADGTCKAEYFATKAEFFASVGYHDLKTEDTQTSAAAGALSDPSSLLQPASYSKSYSHLVTRVIGAKYLNQYMRLDSFLNWSWNGMYVSNPSYPKPNSVPSPPWETVGDPPYTQGIQTVPGVGYMLDTNGYYMTTDDAYFADIDAVIIGHKEGWATSNSTWFVHPDISAYYTFQAWFDPVPAY